MHRRTGPGQRAHAPGAQCRGRARAPRSLPPMARPGHEGSPRPVALGVRRFRACRCARMPAVGNHRCGRCRLRFRVSRGGNLRRTWRRLLLGGLGHHARRDVGVSRASRVPECGAARHARHAGWGPRASRTLAPRAVLFGPRAHPRHRRARSRARRGLRHTRVRGGRRGRAHRGRNRALHCTSRPPRARVRGARDDACRVSGVARRAGRRHVRARGAGDPGRHRPAGAKGAGGGSVPSLERLPRKRRSSRGGAETRGRDAGDRHGLLGEQPRPRSVRRGEGSARDRSRHPRGDASSRR